MSNDNDNESQWGNAPADPQRGPSFEDPTQASPAERPSASELNWDQAWGLDDDMPSAPEAPLGEAHGNWDSTASQQPPPMQGAGYGSVPQGAPTSGDPGFGAGPWGEPPSQGQNPYSQPYPDQNPY